MDNIKQKILDAIGKIRQSDTGLPENVAKRDKLKSLIPDFEKLLRDKTRTFSNIEVKKLLF